jgi:PKD repeat protein
MGKIKFLLFIFLIACLAGTASAAENVISRYDFEGDLNDSVTGIHGVAYGTPTYVSGINGSAVHLSGLQRIDLPSSAWTNVSNNKTVYFNFSWKSDLNNANTYTPFVGIYRDTNNRFVSYVLNGAQLHLRLVVNGVNVDNTLNGYTCDGNWHNISISVGHEGMYFSDNGTVLISDTSTHNNISDIGTPTYVTMGAMYYNTGYMGQFNGTLDNFQVGYEPDVINESVVYPSTNSDINNLTAIVQYPNTIDRLPILVLVHGFSGNSSDLLSTAAYYSSRYFVIIPDMRGRLSAGGSPDYSGMETQDIIDAIEYVKNNATYSQHVNDSQVFAYGISYGGNAVYTLGARYPNYFNAISPNCAVADVGRWYYEAPGYDYSLRTSLGGTPESIPYRYYARSPYNTSSGINAGNNINTPTISFHGTGDTVVYPTHTTNFRDLIGSTDHDFYLWSNYSHGYSNTASFPIIDSFFKSNVNSQPTLNNNLTILGYLTTENYSISIYNNTFNDTVSDVGYYNQSSGTIKVLNLDYQDVNVSIRNDVFNATLETLPDSTYLLYNGSDLLDINRGGDFSMSLQPGNYTIKRAAPVDFYSSSSSGTAPATVQFTDISDNGSCAWDFENDGTIDSTKQNPTHTYGTAGTYSVNLTVYNEYGNFSTVKTDYITVSSPSAIDTLSKLYWWLRGYISWMLPAWEAS